MNVKRQHFKNSRGEITRDTLEIMQVINGKKNKNHLRSIFLFEQLETSTTINGMQKQKSRQNLEILHFPAKHVFLLPS